MASSSKVSPLKEPEVVSITGPVPGQLDPTQPERVLRYPGSKLSFASYDPRTATSRRDIPEFRSLSINEELYRPKRIVLETTPHGACFWRFVPKAKLVGNEFAEEGFWPRTILICGQRVTCSLDQWDIYKLDQNYECTVHPFPQLSVITSKVQQPLPTDAKASIDGEGDATRISETPDPPRASSVRIDELSSDSEDEVAQMVKDKSPRKNASSRTTPGKLHPRMMPVTPQRATKFKAKLEARRARADTLRKYTAKLSEKENTGSSNPSEYGDDNGTSLNTSNASSQENIKTKRRGNVTLRTSEDEDNNERDTKKQRTQSSSKRSVSKNRSTQRMEAKGGKWDNIKQSKQEARDDQFLQETIQEFYLSFSSPDTKVPMPDIAEEEEDTETEHEDDEPETDTRAASIAASIRKMAEFANDKPLRDEAEQRHRREQQEEEERNRMRREKREAMEAALKQEADRERMEREAEVVAEQAAKEAEELERRAAIKANIGRRRKDQQWERWYSAKFWTPEMALARYNALCAVFDNTKFSLEEPLSFEDVPWPVLHRTSQFTIEDATWDAVEQFMRTVRPMMPAAHYKKFLRDSQNRFHPDRWRSRRLLPAIADDAERDCIEIAANAVAQAITPIYHEVK